VSVVVGWDLCLDTSAVKVNHSSVPRVTDLCLDTSAVKVNHNSVPRVTDFIVAKYPRNARNLKTRQVM
jgi:hypothetical protein